MIIRPDHELLAATCNFGATVGAHSSEIFDRAGKKNIVPTANVQRRDCDLAPAVSNTPLLPILVSGVVLHPIEKVTGDFGLFRNEPGQASNWQIGVYGLQLVLAFDQLIDQSLLAKALNRAVGETR